MVRAATNPEKRESPRGPNTGYVVVEGPIGVGKTTLARRLAESFAGELLLEAPQDNPFLERFYRDRATYALQTQLHFLLQRVEQLRVLSHGDLFIDLQVGDYLIAKNRLFAELTLERDELALYLQVHDRLVENIPAPDLVIYLQAPVDVLLERIGRRGIAYEQWIDADYLNQLAQSYARFFHDYDDSALLIVNASAIDLAYSEADYASLLRRIESVRSGRHFFNPLPAR